MKTCWTNAARKVQRSCFTRVAVTLVVFALANPGATEQAVAQSVGARSGTPRRQVVVNFNELAKARAAANTATNQAQRVIHSPKPVPVRKRGAQLQPEAASPVPPPAGPVPNQPGGGPPQEGGSFPAIIDNQTFIPPDTQGAVGPNHLMVTLNSEVAVQTRQGGAVSKVTLDNFWSGLGHASSFDPKILYDHFKNRWLFVALADPQSSSSAIQVGVSSNSDPTGNWTLFDIDVDPADALWADYPNIGFDERWFVVTVNMYPNSGGFFAHSEIYVFNQSNLSATGTFKVFSDPAGTLIPSVSFDAGSTTMYLVTEQDDTSLRIGAISGSVGQENFTAKAAIAVSPQAWSFGPPTANFLPQLGSAIRINANDSRMMNSVLRNGSLWCTHMVFLPAGGNPNRVAVEWWQIAPTGTVRQRGRLQDQSARVHYAFPSLAVNANEDVLIGYSRFSASQYASANYSYRYGGDPPNTLGQDIVLKAGAARYTKDYGSGRVRWGDYSATVVDPLNDLDMWTIQEYAATPDARGDRWGTW
jgi:hypothetical protein